MNEKGMIDIGHAFPHKKISKVKSISLSIPPPPVWPLFHPYHIIPDYLLGEIGAEDDESDF